MRGVEEKVENYLSHAAEQDFFSGVILLARGSDVFLSGSYNQACRLRFCALALEKNSG